MSVSTWWELSELSAGTLVPSSFQLDPPPSLLALATQSVVSVNPVHSALWSLFLAGGWSSLEGCSCVLVAEGSLSSTEERLQLSESAVTLFRKWDCLMEKDRQCLWEQWVFGCQRCQVLRDSGHTSHNLMRHIFAILPSISRFWRLCWRLDMRTFW